jgi:hypothetical protein
MLMNFLNKIILIDIYICLIVKIIINNLLKIKLSVNEFC